MCNPRRVEITATRELHELWQRRIERVVELSRSVTGEARIRQDLDQGLAPPVLQALERVLRAGAPGWREQNGRFRYDLDGGGGFGVFDPAEHSLEIVATLSEQLTVRGTASTIVEGTSRATLTEKTEEIFFDDAWGGHDEARARQVGNQRLGETLDRKARERTKADADAAEAAQDAGLTSQAEQTAHSNLSAEEAAKREQLTRDARKFLQDVGLRVRRAFHGVLALAYQEVIVTIARQRGVDPKTISLSERDGVLELEMTLPD